MRHVSAAHPLFSGRSPGRPRPGEKITQIYESRDDPVRKVILRKDIVRVADPAWSIDAASGPAANSRQREGQRRRQPGTTSTAWMRVSVQIES
jgi:hypothetical protein